MTVRGRPGLLLRRDRTLALAGAVSVGAVLALLIPWLGADPPTGLTFSNAPYTDEGLYGSAARELVTFGSFGRHGLFRQLTNTGYVLAESVVLGVGGPSIEAARVLSVLSVCAMVLLVLWGLSGLIGFPGALVATACVAGSPLVLLYGHVAIVEPFEAAMLVAGFVALARGMAAGRWLPGAIGGVFLAVAVGAKESALLALPGILGVPLVGALITRSRARLSVALAAIGAFAGVVVVWVLAVALPNRGDLHTAARTLAGTGVGAYPHTLGGMAHRLRVWIAHPVLTDHVAGWSVPLLIAVAAAIVVGGLLWRRMRPAHLYVAASGLLWAAGCWAVPVLTGYSPNRYFVIAVPGLAVAAGAGLGPGLEWAAERAAGRPTERVGRPAERVGRPAERVGRPAWRAVAGVFVVAAVALLVFVPGVLTYVRVERHVLGTGQLAADQAAVGRVLPSGAVLFGVYAPEMAFPHHIHVVVPWPQSGLHMDSPVSRYGVGYVIADTSGAASADDRAILRAVTPAGHPLGPPLVTVPWGPHRLAVYRVDSRPSPAG